MMWNTAILLLPSSSLMKSHFFESIKSKLLREWSLHFPFGWRSTSRAQIFSVCGFETWAEWTCRPRSEVSVVWGLWSDFIQCWPNASGSPGLSRDKLKDRHSSAKWTASARLPHTYTHTHTVAEEDGCAMCPQSETGLSSVFCFFFFFLTRRGGRWQNVNQHGTRWKASV